MYYKGALRRKARFDSEYSARLARGGVSRSPYGFREKVFGEDYDFERQSRLNDAGVRKGVARCSVPGCHCSPRRASLRIVDRLPD